MTLCSTIPTSDFYGGEHDGLDYKAFSIDDIHRIYKPVFMSTDKIGEWLTEWGYAYKEIGPYFLIQFKGKVTTIETLKIEDFDEEIPKKKTFWIHDMDITFDEELTQEEMEKRFFDALRTAGVIGHRGCPD